jgi:hypothetical protein
VQGRPPLVSIISPEDARKIRKMQWINFACTMLQVCNVKQRHGGWLLALLVAALFHIA